MLPKARSTAGPRCPDPGRRCRSGMHLVRAGVSVRPSQGDTTRLRIVSLNRWAETNTARFRTPSHGEDGCSSGLGQLIRLLARNERNFNIRHLGGGCGADGSRRSTSRRGDARPFSLPRGAMALCIFNERNVPCVSPTTAAGRYGAVSWRSSPRSRLSAEECSPRPQRRMLLPHR